MVIYWLSRLVDATAIIRSCMPPKVVGEVASSVTVTGMPEVYGLRRRDRDHVRFPARELPAYQEDWPEGDARSPGAWPGRGRRVTWLMGGP